MSTVDHPQTDGQTERMHRTINARLQTLINHAQTDWEEKLPSIEFQINCATNQSTGFAPFVLDMGRIPRSPLSSVTGDSQLKPDVGNASPEVLKQASARFINKLKANLIEARDNIILAQEQQI
jgi:hypothetical protein